MNVLLLYTIEIFPYEQSWYSFYREHPWMRMNETVASMVFRFLVS